VTRASASNRADDGYACLAAIAGWHGYRADPANLRNEFAPDGAVFDFPSLERAAHALGLRLRAARPALSRLSRLPLPAMARMRDGRCLVLAAVRGSRLLLRDPVSGRSSTSELTSFAQAWGGEIVLVAPVAADTGKTRPFGLRWFLPAIKRHRQLFAQVLVASLFVQLFALITPLFFQVIVDKVLVHQGLTTLHVLAVGMLAVTVFEVLLEGLRSYVLAHTTQRIDVTLGARLFAHLLRLPLAYFESRRVGDTVARVRELDRLREFLTGSALTLIVDLVFTLLFFAVLFAYSGVLGSLVLAAVPLYLLLSLAITPPLRRRLDDLFDRGAENQSFLVESVNGIRTLKSLSMEPRWQRQWEGRLAAYVSTGMRTRSLGILAGQSAALVNKLTVVGILWVGAGLVMRGELSVGQLVAFNMIAARISSPILRLVQLWQDLQQASISLRRLGDLLDTPQEGGRGPDRASIASPCGTIVVDGVRFRYRPDAAPVLDGLDLRVAAGEVVGIVGHSGSGKSTLASLLQRLYVPEQGRLRLDGADLALLDTGWLRRQVGVVLQESFLFNRSIRENIALAEPLAPLERVVAAARLAAAHEFISRLPDGYDSLVEEHGANLSGGQRQRIALARALLTDPRVLVLDEATSSLDYESEQAIQRNMRAICRGRTVIIIAHRLTALREAQRILVMDQGRIVEQGSPADLAVRGGHYARMLALQAGKGHAKHGAARGARESNAVALAEGGA
jgi:subfamily B ATP-binding cassette protein HlyB/CyaB